MKVTLIRYTHDADLLCGQAAALCYNAKDPMRSFEHSVGAGHLSVAEHNAFTFLVEGISRVTLAQLTRHRLASFSVQSQRYCGADMRTVTPPSMARAELVDDLVGLKRQAEAVYRKAISLGVPAEDARYYTFQAGETKLVVTMNARELLHFFSLRCCDRAQWEIRELACRMLRLCQDTAPELFRLGGPPCVTGPCPEGKKSCGKPWNERNGRLKGSKNDEEESR